MRVLGVNGIRTDGATNTDLVLHDLGLRGWATHDVAYPKVYAVTARSRARQYRNAERVAHAAAPGDAVVAHSYGCLLVLRAMELGARFGAVFFFGAAMNDDFVFPVLGCERLWNIHAPADRALRLADRLWWHDFGDMGRTGYKGPPDPRVTNVLASARGGSEFWRHSDYFLPGNRQRWVTFIDERLRPIGSADCNC